jgi:hypothetical protein
VLNFFKADNPDRVNALFRLKIIFIIVFISKWKAVKAIPERVQEYINKE